VPKYIFKCTECNKELTKYTPTSTKTIECECGKTMDRQMPRLRGLKNTETVDKFTNKKHIDDHQNILDERKADYYWSVEVPKMVKSGTYQLDTMLEQDWVSFNEKGDLVINTKPPGKR